MDKTLYKYCVGCGLCESAGKAVLENDNKGFFHPRAGDEEWLKKICPSYGKQTYKMDSKAIWGRAKSVYYGWACSSRIRKMASSGGVTTAICCYLLEKGFADAVIQTGASPADPTKTEPCISVNTEEVIDRCGARYAISSPLKILGQLEKDKKYVFVGKPCDVDVLRNYFEIEPSWSKIIPFLISFFCMGLPSDEAQRELLKSMGCDGSKCTSLKYRGDGWPGYTTAVDADGNVYQTDYDSSWGKVLGRDLMPMCRFCDNGIGETADISLGDAWYLDRDNKPSFIEAEGRNVVFARTELGEKILNDALQDGYVHLEPFETYQSELPHSQYAQFERRASMRARIYALSCMLLPHPHYSKRLLNSFAGRIPFSRRMNFFAGIIKRTIKQL